MTETKKDGTKSWHRYSQRGSWNNAVGSKKQKARRDAFKRWLEKHHKPLP